MRTYHTHFGIPLGSIPGWWDERKRNKKTFANFLPTARCSYELRICNKCNLLNIQDEEHIILNCPYRDLTNLRTQFQHLFSSAPPSSATRLRDVMNQAGLSERVTDPGRGSK
eukprot:1137111-Pelagomonas_calceolata.AAC.1